MARVDGFDVAGLKADIAEGWQQVATERLGPAIRDDAKRYCPVDTGALRDSISDSFDEDTGTLIVSATGGAGGRVYALFVETGHRVFHPSTRAVGPEVVHPEPFLRPALYQEREL